MAKEKETTVYQLKISLLYTDIWRRFQVKSDITLPKLHQIIQTLMGWTNSHLHHFIVDGVFYCTPSDDDFGMETVDYKRVKLEKIAGRKGSRFIYEYDFGDSWEHEIVVEEILPVEEGKYYPVCLDGKKACPPEDCGSTPGYEEILKALKNKKNPQYRELLKWVGDEYDPEYFNIEEVNEMLKDKDYGCITLFD